MSKNYDHNDKDKITNTACVSCIWDVDGIWADFNYAYEELRGHLDAFLCFCELYTDGEQKEAIWKPAKKNCGVAEKPR